MSEIILMTGATSGLGKVAACELANQGYQVIVLYRNSSKKEALTVFFNTYYTAAQGSLDFVLCDLNSFDSIAQASEEIHLNYEQIDVLINNAGIMSFDRAESVDSIETTWQTNVLAPMLLSHFLLDLLTKSPQAKLIFTASALHQGHINFDDLESKTKFSSYKAYRQSKLGIILLTRILAERLSSAAIGVYAQHPGMVNTELGRSAGWFSKWVFKMMGTSPQNGAKNLVYLATTAKKELVSGEYYDSMHIKKISAESYDMSAATDLLDSCGAYLQKWITKKSLMFK